MTVKPVEYFDSKNYKSVGFFPMIFDDRGIMTVSAFTDGTMNKKYGFTPIKHVKDGGVLALYESPEAAMEAWNNAKVVNELFRMMP